MGDWTVDDSLELYGLNRWGAGFFSVAESGSVQVHPRGPDGHTIELLELVRELEGRELRTPLLVRFSDILATRITGLAGAFQHAMDEYGYSGRYRGVYPIKVNQQRHVVEEIVQFGAPLGVGLEAGSKPELLVALAILDTPGALIICNGYKDRAYIETALLAQRLGRTPIIVIDRYHELDLIIKTSQELGIRPHIGARGRLSARGAGKWVESTGQRSKFGLSPAELVSVFDRLRAEDMLDCLELVHFHIGSQITAIRAHKEALREISRIYVGLRELGAERLDMIDVGGGLGVDYDGSNTDYHSSMNYSMQEYANDVVATIQEACDEHGLPHPDIVTESGRSLVAHHSVLVFDVLGVNEMRTDRAPAPVTQEDPKVLHDLAEVAATTNADNVQEAYHDVLQIRDEANSLFTMGYLDLRSRARVELHFLFCCQLIYKIVRELPDVPEELENLETDLADTYYGNLSVFQSAPDHWAVKQLFPVMPIHRLDEEPTRRGVFADLTCDSDGKIDRFIGGQSGDKRVLELHAMNGRPYYIGVFLVGAYQEILGDLHNLFGDTDAVHVRLDEEGRYNVEHVVEGDDVSEVLHYVQYDAKALVERVRRTIEVALRRGDISLSDSARLRRRFEQGLHDYTYLTREG
jgi:arginine decarboxylase